MLAAPTDAERAVLGAIPYTANDQFYWNYDDMGQDIFEWPAPDGFPTEATHWKTSNGLMTRWNWIMRIARGNYDEYGIDYDTVGMTPGSLVAPREIVEYWANRVIGKPLSEQTLFALIEFFAEGRSWDLRIDTETREDKVRHLVALCACTPEALVC